MQDILKIPGWFFGSFRKGSIVEATCREGSIVERYFVRKQQRRGPIGELNQIHGFAQTPDMPENNRPFIGPGPAYVIPHGSKQSTMLVGRQSNV